MRYIESPTPFDGQGVSLFLAGGISGCPDWQAEVARHLEPTSLTVLNPLRKNFPINDPSAAEEQIRWEFHHLRLATVKLFWFPSETLCPIALYELGTWSRGDHPLFVGIHPEYQRRLDIEIQTQLVRPDVQIVYSLEALSSQVLEWCRENRCSGKVVET
ncbi:MAG: nucleoside 2-deoxyribosyltransferase domain-containing protein [Planctomycetaceae bacterium]|nr:nucleoside 2-deoxyribosyltransferase domain-containing protein [Planctomycetaceae bacterium]